jgi:hypothetical protein
VRQAGASRGQAECAAGKQGAREVLGSGPAAGELGGRAGCARGRLSEGERGRMDGVDWQEMGWAGFSRSWAGFSRCTGFSRSEVRL